MKNARCKAVFRLAAWACGLAVVTLLRAQTPSLSINVRTTVELPKGKSISAHPTFTMLPAVEVASGEKLVRPVPPTTVMAMHQILQEKLMALGYVPVADKVRPEILITLQYGRGILPNPYTVGMTIPDVGASAGSMAGDGKMTGETGRSVIQRGPTEQMRRFEPGYESKVQFANREKLFCTIAAWNFASMQKGAKPVRYWTTTALVDDPDNRDLNQIYDQLLTAAGEFFNRRIDQEEVEIATRVREGRVEVGVPRVMAEPNAAR